MNRSTGEALDGLAHIAQSVADILATPLGARVMRRDYGSLVPLLIDQPLNAATQARIFAAVASALMRWEPRIRLQRLRLIPDTDPQSAGRAELQLQGVWYAPLAPQPRPLALTIPLNSAGSAGSGVLA